MFQNNITRDFVDVDVNTKDVLNSDCIWIKNQLLMHDLQKTLKEMLIVVDVNANNAEEKSMLFNVVNLDLLVEKSYVLR